mgnify:CR=1 FL=1
MCRAAIRRRVDEATRLYCGGRTVLLAQAPRERHLGGMDEALEEREEVLGARTDSGVHAPEERGTVPRPRSDSEGQARRASSTRLDGMQGMMLPPLPLLLVPKE